MLLTKTIYPLYLVKTLTFYFSFLLHAENCCQLNSFSNQNHSELQQCRIIKSSLSNIRDTVPLLVHHPISSMCGRWMHSNLHVSLSVVFYFGLIVTIEMHTIPPAELCEPNPPLCMLNPAQCMSLLNYLKKIPLIHHRTLQILIRKKNRLFSEMWSS